jgi:hypothetical protein
VSVQAVSSGAPSSVLGPSDRVEVLNEEDDDLIAGAVGAVGVFAEPLAALSVAVALGEHLAVTRGQAAGANGERGGGEGRFVGPSGPGERGVTVADAPVVGRQLLEFGCDGAGDIGVFNGVDGVVAVGRPGCALGGEPVLEADPVADRVGVVARDRGELEFTLSVEVAVLVAERAGDEPGPGRIDAHRTFGGSDGLGDGRRQVGAPDGDVVHHLVVFGLDRVAPTDTAEAELGVVAGLDLHDHESPVREHALELGVIDIGLIPEVNAALARGDVDPEVRVVLRLTALVGVGVPEEVDGGLTARGAERLHSLDDPADVRRVAGRPDPGQVRVVELGEDEVDLVIRRGVGEDAVEPVELLLDSVISIAVEPDEPDVAVVLVPPVLLEARACRSPGA